MPLNANDESTVDGSLFEGLAKALQPSGTFADDLRAVGFDPTSPRIRYTTVELAATLDVCHRHLYPDLTRDEAQRRLGQRVVESFFNTIFGKVSRTLLQVLGPERFLVRLPKIVPMGSTGTEVRVERPTPGEVRLFFKGNHLSPVFIAGTVDIAAGSGTVELVAGAQPSAFELRVTGLR